MSILIRTQNCGDFELTAFKEHDNSLLSETRFKDADYIRVRNGEVYEWLEDKEELQEWFTVLLMENE